MTNKVLDFGDVALDNKTVNGLQEGIMRYTYKGVPMLKCPFDLAIYLQVIWELKPKTILEFGSKFGGSALWLADMLTNFDLGDCKLISYDIKPVQNLVDPRITFAKVDVSRPQDFISASDLASLQHPILVIDDASHQYSHVLALLEFLHPHLRKGDYLIVEDGILDALGMTDSYGGGPVKAIKEFLASHVDDYVVDRTRCDTFGKNVTWNVEGYLRRIA